MKDCIVTQYFCGISGDAPKFGELKLGTLAANSTKTMQFNGYDGFTCEIKGDGVSIQGKTNPYAPGVGMGSPITFVTTDHEGEIVLNNKYEAYYINPVFSSDGFVPSYQLMDFQFCVKVHVLRLAVASGLTGNVTEVVLAMLHNGRVNGDMYVQFNGLLSYYNGTINVTPTGNTWLRFVFKSNGYTLYAASSQTDTEGALIYDYTES